MSNLRLMPIPIQVWLRALVLLLAGMLFWGTQASATVACKNSVQKNGKACAAKVQSKKPAPKQTARSKHAANCTRAKGAAARRACVAANRPARTVTPLTSATSAEALSNAAQAAPDPYAPTAPCFTALAKSQAAQHMAAKVPFLAGQSAGPAALDNASYPSKKEQTELSSLIAGYQMCRDMSAPGNDSGAGGETDAQDNQRWQARKSVLNQLQAGKLSFGAAARALSEAS